MSATSRRPGSPDTVLVNRLASLSGVPVRVVRGRRADSGRAVPVKVLEHHGTRYLVAAPAGTNWVRSLRAAWEGLAHPRAQSNASKPRS